MLQFLTFVLTLGAVHAKHDRAAALDDTPLPAYLRVLSFLFALGFVVFLYWFVGSATGGPGPVGFRYAMVMFVIVGGTSLVVLIALIHAAFFRPKSMVHRVISLVFAVAIIVTWTGVPHRDRSRHSTTNVPASKKVVEPEMSPAAEARVAEAERQQLIAKLEALRVSNRQSWLARIESSGATGAPGTVPPMLEVHVRRLGVWQVKNLSAASTCVRLARVAPPRESGEGWVRCELDASNTCLEIPAGASRLFALESAGLTGGCPNSRLEFRVGHEEQAGPSWWTQTALAELEQLGPKADTSHRRWTAERLRDEIAALEKLTMPVDIE